METDILIRYQGQTHPCLSPASPEDMSWWWSTAIGWTWWSTEGNELLGAPRGRSTGWPQRPFWDLSQGWIRSVGILNSGYPYLVGNACHHIMGIPLEMARAGLGHLGPLETVQVLSRRPFLRYCAATDKCLQDILISICFLFPTYVSEYRSWNFKTNDVNMP